MINKTQKALDYWKNKEYAKALSIFAKFRLGFSKEEKRTLEIAHDIHQGRGKFYEQLGYNLKTVCSNAHEILLHHYGASL